MPNTLPAPPGKITTRNPARLYTYTKGTHMKYTLKLRSTVDPHFLPWDLVVADTKYPNVLTAQSPSPFAGDNLIGFERTFGECEVTTIDAEWPEKAIGLHPVFATKGGMYSSRAVTIREVIAVEDEVQV